MRFSITREEFLKPLQLVVGAVEKRQAMPILSHFLLEVNTHQLSVTATDTEVELVGRATLSQPAETGTVTTQARKLIDICRSLANDVVLDIVLEEQRLLIKAGSSRFTLATLDAEGFPATEDSPGDMEFNLQEKILHRLLQATHFSMAQQDVRYYLNGMLLRVDGSISTVATDGHRLAMCTSKEEFGLTGNELIIPRKGVHELLRLLDNNGDREFTVTLMPNHIRLSTKDFTFTSKLIHARFPDYNRVIPKKGNIAIVLERERLKGALSRAAILSNEKYRGVSLTLKENTLRIVASNPEQEEAIEELEVNYKQETLEIGFNVSYLLDILANIPSGDVRLVFTDASSSLLIESVVDPNVAYVVMPMRI